MDRDSDSKVILPKGWPNTARAAYLSAVAMLRMTTLQVLSGFEHGSNPKAQLFTELERMRARCARLEEVGRIEDARFARIPPAKRPRYAPVERLAILAARAAAGWNLAETAKVFQVTPKTVASWTRRVDDEGRPQLVATAAPVNRYPDFVRLLVRQLRLLQPSFGRRRIAEFLARAGLHVAPSTVKRILDEPPPPVPEADEENGDDSRTETAAVDEPEEPTPPQRAVTARYPHHVWHIDASVVPTLGFWVPWLSNSLPIVWPFAFWVVAVLDHHSRSVVARGVFRSHPTAEQVVAVLKRAAAAAGRAPKHIISDQGSQFQDAYLLWCSNRSVAPRFGAIGQHGSIAIIERFWRSMKTELFRRICIPLSLDQIDNELGHYIRWYNLHRPHRGMAGATPAERLTGVVPACELQAMEVRPGMPLARGDPAGEARRVEHLALVVTSLEGRNHLPIVELREAA